MDIKGKEVILPALSFVSTANAVLYNGGIPVFGDIEEDTLCLDMDNLPTTEKTVCVLPVHFGGMKATSQRKYWEVQDSAHRVERNTDFYHLNISCYSFHPVKNLAMPCGGAIATNADFTYTNKLRDRRWCGITDRVDDKYDVKELGWNYYMNEVSAAIGLVQLKKLDEMNKRRYEIAKRYKEGLLNPHETMPLDKNCSYHLFWKRVRNRDKFRKKMKEAGIETGTHY